MYGTFREGLCFNGDVSSDPFHTCGLIIRELFTGRLPCRMLMKPSVAFGLSLTMMSRVTLGSSPSLCWM